jgi:hypothetical protein
MTMTHEDVNVVDRSVRIEIYKQWIATGGPPSASDIAQALNQSVATAESSFQRLAAAKVLTLAPVTGRLWMVHPFSAVPTPYRVRTAGRSFWANCAWDALGVAAIVGHNATIVSACPDCGDPVDLSVHSSAVASNGGVVHFVVPPLQFWDNVAFT